MALDTDPFTGNRYTFGAGNPVSNIELTGHLFCSPGDTDPNCDAYRGAPSPTPSPSPSGSPGSGGNSGPGGSPGAGPSPNPSPGPNPGEGPGLAPIDTGALSEWLRSFAGLLAQADHAHDAVEDTAREGIDAIASQAGRLMHDPDPAIRSQFAQILSYVGKTELGGGPWLKVAAAMAKAADAAPAVAVAVDTVSNLLGGDKLLTALGKAGIVAFNVAAGAAVGGGIGEMIDPLGGGIPGALIGGIAGGIVGEAEVAQVGGTVAKALNPVQDWFMEQVRQPIVMPPILPWPH